MSASHFFQPDYADCIDSCMLILQSLRTVLHHADLCQYKRMNANSETNRMLRRAQTDLHFACELPGILKSPHNKSLSEVLL